MQFAGLVSPGEFQFNVVVPNGTTDGDKLITVTYNGILTQNGTLLTVRRICLSWRSGLVRLFKALQGAARELLTALAPATTLAIVLKSFARRRVLPFGYHPCERGSVRG